jgi:hypothetical protein
VQKTVVFPQYLQDRFKKSAKKIFPVEECAFLIGRKDENGDYRVEDLYFPEDRLEHSSDVHIDISSKWFRTAQETYFERGQVVLGFLHSHCYDAKKEGIADLMPSLADVNAVNFFKAEVEPYYSITGILRLVKNGARIRSDLALYPLIVPFNVQAA